MCPNSVVDASQKSYHEARITHWNGVAIQRDHWRGWGAGYHARLQEVYRFLVSPGLRVLELGCGMGDLLSAVKPSAALGIDFSSEMLRRGRLKHPEIRFVEADATDLTSVEGQFDVIILSDAINDLWDVQAVFEQIRRLCSPSTRIILNFHSGLWQLPLAVAQRLGVASPMLAQNWFTPEDASGMLRLAGFETIRTWHEVLWPFGLVAFFNKFLVRLWPFSQMALANFMIARLQPEKIKDFPSVSLVIPARNESGNIGAIFERMPEMAPRVELIFVEGHSRDDTAAAIEREIAAHPETRASLLHQKGVGKADAVRLGFEHATGDALMILDADLTVPPEDLPRFLEALCSGQGEFINGVRLVYPMEKQAMQGWNLLGNKLFSMAFSWILGQPLKDTLCGTKALWRRHYELMAANRGYFGEFDPFGDYDLIFGAAKLNLKIVDMPIRYRERTYGTTNISRWRHGLLLFRMVAVAAARLKFV